MCFNEWGTIQMISYIFKKKRIPKINYTKLLKIIYFIERECIKQGLPTITYSDYVLMDNGPVALDVLDRVDRNYQNYTESDSIWHEYIETCNEFYIRFTRKCESCDFSPEYIAIFDSVIKKYKNKRYGSMIRETHRKEYDWYRYYKNRPNKSLNILDLPIDKMLDTLGETPEEKEKYIKLYNDYRNL